jgi:hypothetical protein
MGYAERAHGPFGLDARRGQTQLATQMPFDLALAIRSAMYRLVRLPEPTAPARTLPVPVPRPVQVTWGQW